MGTSLYKIPVNITVQVYVDTVLGDSESPEDWEDGESIEQEAEALLADLLTRSNAHIVTTDIQYHKAIEIDDIYNSDCEDC